MTFHGFFSKLPDKRAAALYHLGMKIRYRAQAEEALNGPLSSDQQQALNIFMGELETLRRLCLKELGHNV